MEWSPLHLLCSATVNLDMDRLISCVSKGRGGKTRAFMGTRRIEKQHRPLCARAATSPFWLLLFAPNNALSLGHGVGRARARAERGLNKCSGSCVNAVIAGIDIENRDYRNNVARAVGLSLGAVAMWIKTIHGVMSTSLKTGKVLHPLAITATFFP